MVTQTDRKSIFWQQQGQLRVPIITAGLVFICILMSVTRFIMDGHFSTLLFVQLSTTVVCIVSFILYRTRYQAFAVHLLLVAGILSILGTGGLNSPGIAWLPLVPLLAAFLANNWSAGFYTVATLLGLAFFWLKAESLEYSHFSSALAIVFACGFAVFLEGARIKYERRIVELATSNPVTDLPSRIVFDVLLDRAVGLFKRDGSPFVLMFVDVNGLKFVNDTFGHPAGDELLREVGRRLSEKVKSTETLFHISGDEFVIVANHTQNLKELKAHIRGIGGEFVYHDFQIPLSISVGASHCTTDAKTTLAAADDDMYLVC